MKTLALLLTSLLLTIPLAGADGTVEGADTHFIKVTYYVSIYQSAPSDTYLCVNGQQFQFGSFPAGFDVSERGPDGNYHTVVGRDEQVPFGMHPTGQPCSMGLIIVPDEFPVFDRSAERIGTFYGTVE